MRQGAACAMRTLLLLFFASVFLSPPSAASSYLRFIHDGYNATIQENSLPRTYVGSRRLMGVSLDAVPPSSQIRFFIKGGDTDGFFTAETEEIGGIAVLHIRTRTGLSDVLNRERTSDYFLSVVGEVRNNHKSFSSSVATTVQVKVLDVNDNIPLFFEDSYKVSIGEDARVHSSLITVFAEDADYGSNGKVYYAMDDTKSDLFSVHPTSGVVSLTRPLDHSEADKYNLVIVAEDRGAKPHLQRNSAASTTVVHVKVLKVNLHSPRLRVNHLPHVVEHSHTNIYAIITVTDEDIGKNGAIKSVDIIHGDPSRLFKIIRGTKPNEYNLAVLKLLDRELAPKGYNLTIRAVDNGYPERSGIANIRVSIADINDQAPVFLKEQYDEAISEEAPPHSAVVRVAASDIDQGSNGQVLFRILAGNDDNKFTINQYTGLIYTNDWLNAETTGYYSLAVAAIDQASNAQRKQSSAKVIIRVLDGNDNAPQFSTPNTEVTIDENEPTGSYVTRVLAADVDSGENGFVSYSIANLDQVPFTIDPFDGTIRTSKILDYEAERRIYTIKVRASDWGQPLKRETETTVKVKVRDVNDNRPVFVGNVCSGWIDLDAPIGSMITKFQAVDLDEGNKVYYRLEESDLRDCWALDTTIGVMSLSCKLRERYSQVKKRSLVINVTATDGRHISDKAILSIAVIDKEKDVVELSPNNARVACEETNILKKQSDNKLLAKKNNEAEEIFALFPLRYGYNTHAPEFPPKFPEIVDVMEDVELDYVVLNVGATDHDRGHNGRIVYSIAGGDVDSVFKIDTNTGVISIWASLDREKTDQYTLNITVYDLGVPHKSSSKNVTINVLDVNDNSPEFDQVSYSLHLPENTRNGTSVAHIIARDNDLGPNGHVTYELITKLKDFTLDPVTGVLYVTNVLDRETRDEFDLRVRAWDNAEVNPRFSLARVLITVLDINDCAPDFGTAKTLKVSVPEDYPIGAVIATLLASDKDLGSGGVVTYSFVSGHEQSFRIDSSTGVVRVTSKLDFENRQIYNITVKAEDEGYPVLSSLATLLVQVTNVDENSSPPQLAKRVVQASVLENQPPGTFVTKVEASDPDKGSIYYDIVAGSGHGIFSINEKGEIRTLRRLDRETSNGYWLSVAVSDGGTVPQTDTCHVFVEVSDINDHVPQTELPVYRPTVSEDAPVGSTVVILRSSDGDLAPSNISYFISRSRKRRNGWMLSHPEGEEDAQEVFDVDKLSGVVTTKAPLDRERQSEYDLWIGVTDGQLTSLTALFINIIDVNDNAPQFLEKVYRFNVPARDKPEKRLPLFRVFALDEDVGRNADIRYSIKMRRGKSKFKVDENSGHIFTLKPLPSGQTHELTVKATDNGNPQLSSTALVIIRVEKVPEKSNHPPSIDAPPTAHVTETDRPGHVVTFISAFDDDNDTLWYYLEDGNDGDHFSIGLDSGLISLAKELDREAREKYKLTVAVTDGVHTSRAPLIVQVMDSNDHRPVFSQTVYRTSVSENLKPGSQIMKLLCHDRDRLSTSPSFSPLVLPSSSLFFSFHHTESVESSSLFSLEANSGNLTLAQPLDRELLSAHTLTVSCEDRGGIQREDLARVIITVEDSNDHVPIFLETMIEVEVSEGAAVGSVVARVTAVDHDLGDNGKLSYAIVEGNEGATFTIDEELGYLTLAQSLFQRTSTEYLLLVRAMDHATNHKTSSVPVRITVKSSPETPPTWRGTDLPKVVELSEWTPINTVVSVVATASHSSIVYQISAGNSEQEPFVVSPSSGVLSVRMPLDYEVTSWYNLTIRATNSAGLFREIWLGVRVLDENDWAPEWEEIIYSGSVVDTAAIGDPIIVEPLRRIPEPLTVSATDKDSPRNGRVTYSLLERNLRNLFSVDEFTGAVRVAGRLDELSGKEVRLSVWARDSGDPRRECVAAATVNVRIRRTKSIRLVFSKDSYSTNVYLPTVQGVKVLCVPVDGAKNDFELTNYNSVENLAIKPLSYEIISGDEDDHFRVDGSNGCIYVLNHVDLKPFYNLTLEATPQTHVLTSMINRIDDSLKLDGERPANNDADTKSKEDVLSATTFVVIQLKTPPVGAALKFTQEKFYANVLENTTKEMNLLMVGIKGLPINHHVTYSLLNANDFFEIRTTSGILKTTGKPFDREKQDHFAIIVEAREIERPDNFGHVTVHVAVLDVNDNEPVFVGLPYDVLVSSAAEKGYVVTKVRAIDADSGAFGEVRYELVRGSGELFGVGKKTGAIILKQPISSPDKAFSLTVAAYDGGKQPLSSQAHVIIRVVSADGPMFDQALFRVSVPENKPVKSAVTRIEARSPSGNDIIYTIVAGDPDSLFDVDYRTGVLRVVSPLDYELKSSHNLTLRGRDPLTGLYSDCHVIVAVTDINDNAPEFTNHVFHGEISEASSLGYTILKLQAYDKDTGSGGIIRYECVAGCQNFTVDAESGYVILTAPLDAEYATTHVLKVTAKDLGLHSLTTSATVIIKVLDMNDNPPVWSQGTYHCRVSTEAKAGHVITSLSAKDPDISNSDGSKLVYHIIAGDSEALFHLDPHSGLLSVTAPQKLIGGSTVVLNVSASDGFHVSFTSLRITVLASNDHSPRFLKAAYESLVEENVAPGQFVISVEVDDEDGDPFGVSQFEILGQEKVRLFSIDEQGKISTEAPLDRETKSLHEIVVSVRDGGGKSDFTTIKVFVQDQNDNSPAFALPQYQANIPVDSPPDTIILEVTAIDADEGKNSRVSYGLYEDNNTEALRLFTVDQGTGQVLLTQEVAGRENEVFQFFIRATDGGEPALHSDVPVTIFLINTHERAPFCSKKYAQFFLQEDAQIGSVVTSLWTSGPMDVKYSILSNDYSSDEDGGGGEILFALTPTGEMVVERPLDHESKRVHKITVVNQTITTPPLVDYMTISIVVMDINDCSPEFSSSSYDVMVAENTNVGQVIAKISASDKDIGSNGQVQYTLKNTTEDWVKWTVSVDPHTGSISLDSPLDREANSSFSFVVVATDSGPNPLSSQSVVNIRIQDYNDNPPVFSKDVYVTNVLEDSVIGTVIVELSLTDEDAILAPLDFFVMSGDDGGRFLVHASGQVYVAGPLDREMVDHYTLIVTATDGKFSANTSVYITVIDVNDNGPTCQEPVYRRTVSEDVPVGTHLVSVLAYDNDEGANARSRFLLSGEGSKDFFVDQQAGKLVTANRLDRESQDLYHLQVLVEDWEFPEWKCKSSLIISVSDVNDNPPRFPQESVSVFISEDAPVNAVLTKIIASDNDLGVNRWISYSLRDSADGHFEIDKSEGIVSLTKLLDRESKDTFRLTVEAKDMGTPSFTASSVIVVTVTDVNDNPPEFVRTLQQVTVAENVAIGTDVSRVMATSRDIGVNAEITYHLEHTTEEEYLKIHPKTGVITVNSPLDYEKVQLVVATVIAVDGGVPPLSSTALLNVTVTDVNDNSPVFSRSSYETEVSEDQLPGRSILQVSAIDADCSQNGEVVYSILRGNKEGLFDVERNSGIISLRKTLDREKRSEYELEITASDKGSPVNSANALVKIKILDVNDNPPKFLRENFSVIVQENRPVGYAVLRFIVTDADADPNGRPFTWELLGHSPLSGSTGSPPFTLDQDGTLRLATNKLNHRVKNSYTIEVRVWDSGSPPLSSDTGVEVTIVEESRYPPTIFPLQTIVVSYLKPYPGGVLGKVTALDQDPYDSLQYAILPGKNQPNYFEIDEEDGTIVALSPLDAGDYVLNVSVSDGKYEKRVKASISVSIIGDDMLENSVIVQIGPLAAEEFLSRYHKIFLTTFAYEIGVEKGNIKILSLQPAIIHTSKTGAPVRRERDLHRSLDVLIVAKNNKGKYMPRKKVIELLKNKAANIKTTLSLPFFTVMNSVCNGQKNCSDNGMCVDVVAINEDVSVPLNTQSSSLVAPKFSQKAACMCDQGYDGVNCETLVNACGRRPCLEHEECIPSTTLSRGYSCHCPSGMVGPRCNIDLAQCQKPSCHYPLQPFSFKGKGYAQYNMKKPLESSSIRFSTYMRTRHPVGVIFFAAGDVDYNILEVSDGYIQYRWDCGSGEGLVRVPHLRVDDNEWHQINITREGTVSELLVDGKFSSGAAPGVHDILNLDSRNLYIGAKVETYVGPFRAVHSVVEFGFVGCIDMINLNGINLPVALDSQIDENINLKRLANVELQCPENLLPPGICGSQPCLNGGTCIEQGLKYSCSCPPRFTGSHCNIDTAPCSSSPCLNGGKCSVDGHNYMCKCSPKLSGKRCEYGVFCNPNPCQNGGRCEEGTLGPICKCQHFTGSQCEIDIDECTRSPCRNGGTCLNLYGGFRCLCASNVTGEYCTEFIAESNTRSSFFFTFKELVYILAIVLACILVLLALVAWQRRRWQYKRHQQNNRVKLTGHHVKNDLKANDVNKRNSKICNVEADQLQQLGSLLPRPSSFTPTGTADSALLHTLKQLAELSVSEHEALELSTLTRRRSNEYVQNLSKPSAMVAPTMASSPSTTETRNTRKPWDHHNNLNETYFTPSKDVGFDLPPNLDEHTRAVSPCLNTSFCDNTSAPTHQQQQRGYNWDDYDTRGSTTMLTFGAPSNNLRTVEEHTSNLALPSSDQDRNEDEPLIQSVVCDPSLSASRSRIASPSTPLLSPRNRSSYDGGNDEDSDDDTCSFQEVLQENDISVSSDVDSDKNRNKELTGSLKVVHFNIVDDEEEKISNIPTPPVANGDVSPFFNSKTYPKPSDDSVPGYTTTQTSKENPELSNHRFGSPRSRRPFVRTDFGRVSDVSFLSHLDDDDEADESLKKSNSLDDQKNNSNDLTCSFDQYL